MGHPLTERNLGDGPMNDQFPVLQGDRRRLIDAQKVDEAPRRVLWRAFQHGALSEDEFASALDRLEFATTVLEPVLDSPSRAERGAKKGAYTTH
jgi:hypothetical protein